MSSRGIIHIIGLDVNQVAPRGIRLYRHQDCYPSTVLPEIACALETTNEQLRIENSQYTPTMNPCSYNVDQIMGLLIGAASGVTGMPIAIDHHPDNPGMFFELFHRNHLGNQVDLEWIYVIDLFKKSLSVYGGNFTGEIPQVAFRAGPVDPLKQIEQMKEQFREQTREQIQSALEEIKSLGFVINPGRKQK